MVLRKGSFGLGANSDFLRKRNHLLRTISSQPAPSSPTGSIHNRPERTQSQSDGERLESAHSHSQAAAQRSMSITASCWGRSGSTKLEPGVFSHKWYEGDGGIAPLGKWPTKTELSKRHVKEKAEYNRGGWMPQYKQQVLQTSLFKLMPVTLSSSIYVQMLWLLCHNTHTKLNSHFKKHL